MWPHLSTSYLAQVSHRRRLVLSPCILLFTRDHLFQVAPSADYFEADPIASSWTEIIRDKNTHTKKQFSCGDGADVAVAVRSLLIIIKKTGRGLWGWCRQATISSPALLKQMSGEITRQQESADDHSPRTATWWWSCSPLLLGEVEVSECALQWTPLSLPLSLTQPSLLANRKKEVCLLCGAGTLFRRATLATKWKRAKQEGNNLFPNLANNNKCYCCLTLASF